MGILSTLAEEHRAIKLGSVPPRDPVLAQIFGLGNMTSAGVRVTPDSAYGNDAVYASVKVLSEGVAQVPLALFRKVDERSRERAMDHPLWRVLHDTPNSWQTSVEFREMMQGHILLRGNAYAAKVLNNGQIEQLIPMHPDRVRPFWVDRNFGVRAYKFTPMKGSQIVLLDDEVFHLAGLSFDGLKGVNPIEAQRETIGTAMAAQEYISKFYANNATPGGVLKHPARFRDPEKRKEFREQWHEQQTGSQRHMTALLEDGIEFQQVSLKLKDAQFVEGQRLSVNQIARIFRVPPHMIGDLSKATFSNITQQSLEFVMYSLAPWFARWEQAIFRDLLVTETDKLTLFAKFIVEGLLRGDIKTRFEAYRVAVELGWMTRNEVRQLEDLNPLDGLDEPLTPLNMQQGDDGGEDDDEDEASTNEQDRALRIISSGVDRVVRKEKAALTKIFQRDGFVVDMIKDFYAGHDKFVAEAMAVTLEEAGHYCRTMRDFVCDCFAQDLEDSVALERVGDSAYHLLMTEVSNYGT